MSVAVSTPVLAREGRRRESPERMSPASQHSRNGSEAIHLAMGFACLCSSASAAEDVRRSVYPNALQADCVCNNDICASALSYMENSFHRNVQRLEIR